MLALVEPGWEGVGVLDVSCLPLSDAGLARVLAAAEGPAGRGAGGRLTAVDLTSCGNLSGNALGALMALPRLRVLRIGGTSSYGAAVPLFLRSVAAARRETLAQETDDWEEREEASSGAQSQWAELAVVHWTGAAASATPAPSVGELAGVALERGAAAPLDAGVAATAGLPRAALLRRAHATGAAVSSEEAWEGLSSPLAEAARKPLTRHISERFRRAYEARALRLEGKRAKNRRKVERQAAAAWDG